MAKRKATKKPEAVELPTRSLDVAVECAVKPSFRVEQAAGMFDIELQKKMSRSWSVKLPEIDGDWQIGVIVGPSGSGKSTIAREAFGKHVYSGHRWPKDAAVVDGFGDRPIKEITHALTSVGFSSPPSWLKPYGVLSNGEQFRCDLARALLCSDKLVVFDEFTSVVDRTVAKVGSAAVAKAVRKGRIERKFVAVTCHYDVVDWLAADWVLDMASGRLARGCLRRPEIKLEIAPVHRSAWLLFRHHHYLSGFISPVAKCFAAFIGEEPVAFSAWIHRITKQRRDGDRREHRTVVLPDYQGVGIGNRLSEFCASIFKGVGGRAFSTTSHPAMIRYRSASPRWHRVRLGMAMPCGTGGCFRPTAEIKYKANSCNRVTGGFEYTGAAMARERARVFLASAPDVFCKRESVVLIERLVGRWPGATVGLLVRLSGMSSTGVRHNLDELIEAGDVIQAGRGGGGGHQFAFYPSSSDG